MNKKYSITPESFEERYQVKVGYTSSEAGWLIIEVLATSREEAIEKACDHDGDCVSINTIETFDFETDRSDVEYVKKC